MTIFLPFRRHQLRGVQDRTDEGRATSRQLSLRIQGRRCVATLKKVLSSWGPGCFDAELDKDGKALRPDGKRACTLIPPALGLAGVNLHTWTGFGSVTYWNAYVAATEMHGSGTSTTRD